MLDSEGYLHFIGRQSDTITLGDLTKVSSNTVVSIIHQCSSVREVIVQRYGTPTGIDQLYLLVNTR